MQSSPVIVVGPGALGVLFAARLADAGHEVVVGVRDAKRAKSLPDAWTLTDPSGHVVTAPASTAVSPKSVAAPAKALIIATKADAAAPALKHWLPALAPDGAVVPLQNGILGDTLAPIAKDRYVECTVGIPATLVADGHSQQTGPGELIIGPWPDGRMGPATPLERAAGLLTDVAPTRIHQNMLGVKWTKLLINSAITGLGALTGESLGVLLDDRRARTAFLHIITEGHRAGHDQGITFEKVNRFSPRMFSVERSRAIRIASRHALLKFMARQYRGQRSSSLQSLERGERTEVDHLNGRIAQEALKGDRHAPVNEAITTLVHDIEDGRLQPSMTHLDKLPFRFD